MCCQTIGLFLNLFGTVLFGYGALDRSQKTIGDISNTSDKERQCTIFVGN